MEISLGTTRAYLNMDNGKIALFLTAYLDILESVNTLIFHSRRSTNKAYN